MVESYYSRTQVIELLAQAVEEDGSFFVRETDMSARMAAARENAAARLDELDAREPEVSDGVSVTVTDPMTGEMLESKVIQDNYVIVCAGTCHVAHENHYPKTGTVQLTIKGRK